MHYIQCYSYKKVVLLLYNYPIGTDKFKKKGGHMLANSHKLEMSRSVQGKSFNINILLNVYPNSLFR